MPNSHRLSLFYVGVVKKGLDRFAYVITVIHYDKLQLDLDSY